jgi:hypothetical protein
MKRIHMQKVRLPQQSKRWMRAEWCSLRIPTFRRQDYALSRYHRAYVYMRYDNPMSHISLFESTAKSGPRLSKKKSTRMSLSTSLAGLKSKLIPYSTLSIICVPLFTCGVVYSFLHVLSFVCAEFSLPMMLLDLCLGQVAYSRTIKCGGTSKQSNVQCRYFTYLSAVYLTIQ